jgi:hypothetical protein
MRGRRANLGEGLSGKRRQKLWSPCTSFEIALHSLVFTTAGSTGPVEVLPQFVPSRVEKEVTASILLVRMKRGIKSWFQRYGMTQHSLGRERSACDMDELEEVNECV